LNHKQQLSVISKLWGDQEGYVFFPWIDGTASNREERIQSWHEDTPFKWPSERQQILDHMAAHTDDDLYWCPTIFEEPRRIQEWAMEHYGLWADLDEVDPRELEAFSPSYAWESSPGRYQGIWLLEEVRRYNIADRGQENHKLTQYLEADPSGWDVTQLMRIPEWRNHKFSYVQKYGEAPMGRMLKASELPNARRIWDITDFDDLPPVPGSAVPIEITVLEDQIKRIDRHDVYARVRLKLHSDVRSLISAKQATGDRSDVLWRLERDLADAGCSEPEIVAILKPTVWNKFEGRSDEMHRLITEATKAVAARPPEVEAKLEVDLEAKPEPEDFDTLVEKAKSPLWLVRNIWPQGTLGFIAGQPKSWKSWTALDLALSVSTGATFLAHFRVERPGPVLYLQEEDGASLLKARYGKMKLGKQTDRVMLDGDGQVMWIPPEENKTPPKMKALVRRGMTISDDGWQVWLDEQLSKGYVRAGANDDEAEPYVMLVLDPLLMMVGEVEENRASTMNAKVYHPLKLLASKHDVAIVIVHHMRKGSSEGTRGGQMMLGSAATHGAAESALYFTHDKGGLQVEVEHKNAIGGSFRLANLKNKEWEPRVMNIDLSGVESAAESPPNGSQVIDGAALNGSKRYKKKLPEGIRGERILKALSELSGSARVVQIAELTNLSKGYINNCLTDMEVAGVVSHVVLDDEKAIYGRKPNLWTLNDGWAL
jgi:hypothetical protein